MTNAEKRQLILATSNSPAYIQGMVEREISKKRSIKISEINPRDCLKPIDLDELLKEVKENVK